MSSPVVIVASSEELRAIVRDELRAELAALSPAATSPAPLLDKRELAAALRVSTASIDRYTAAGVVPYVTLGPDGPRRYDLGAVREALSSTSAGTPAKAAARERVPGVRWLSPGAAKRTG
jgi:hypothetical protein